MIKRLPQLLFTLFVIASLGTIAFAQPQPVVVGSLNLLDAPAFGIEAFDIQNDTGPGSTTGITTSTGGFLTFTVVSLVVTTGDGIVNLSASDFTADALNAGGLDCSSAACNLIGDGGVLGAVFTGTISPTSGIVGLPSDDTDLAATITANPPPSTNIIATALPEPGAWGLIFALTGLVLIWRAAPYCWRRLHA
jgi:hypothetical protein